MTLVIFFSLITHANATICFQIAGSSNMVHRPQIHEVAKTVLLESSELVMRRMGIEVNDYAGSGANNRHTPRPLLGRRCNDC
ncbi:hypothetical protein ACS0TY_006806 [Phlomoides rotata]